MGVVLNMNTLRTIMYIACLAFLISCKNKPAQSQLKNTNFTFTTTDSIKLPVKVAGQGSPCMFVPGGPGGGYLSFEQLGGKNLEKTLTMIYMDQRGSGSAQNARDYSMDRVLKDMDEVRAKLGIDKMYLMSHSFGGVILTNYAKKYPEHVKGLILANSTLYFFSPQMLTEQLEFGYKLLGTDTVIKTKNTDSLADANMLVRQKLSKKHIAYKFLTDSISTIVALDKLDEKYPRTNDFAIKMLGPILDKKSKMLYPEYFKDYTPMSATIGVPTLIINGGKDHAIGPDHYKLFKFPDALVTQINGGHLLYYEQNQAFVKAVQQFIERVDSRR